ncbi:2-isopropylmalate synthase [Balamuthia mandrillaris]
MEIEPSFASTSHHGLPSWVASSTTTTSTSSTAQQEQEPSSSSSSSTTQNLLLKRKLQVLNCDRKRKNHVTSAHERDDKPPTQQLQQTQPTDAQTPLQHKRRKLENDARTEEEHKPTQELEKPEQGESGQSQPVLLSSFLPSFSVPCHLQRRHSAESESLKNIQSILKLVHSTRELDGAAALFPLVSQELQAVVKRLETLNGFASFLAHKQTPFPTEMGILCVLSTEMLLHIFSFLSPKELCVLRATCRQLFELGCSDIAWKERCKRRFKVLPNRHHERFGKSWEWLYRCYACTYRSKHLLERKGRCVGRLVEGASPPKMRGKYFSCGEFLNGELHGYGMEVYFSDGGLKGDEYMDVWEGEYKHGVLHGFGSWREGGVLRYEGQWKEGMVCSPQNVFGPAPLLNLLYPSSSQNTSATNNGATAAADPQPRLVVNRRITLNPYYLARRHSIAHTRPPQTHPRFLHAHAHAHAQTHAPHPQSSSSTVTRQENRTHYHFHHYHHHVHHPTTQRQPTVVAGRQGAAPLFPSHLHPHNSTHANATAAAAAAASYLSASSSGRLPHPSVNKPNALFCTYRSAIPRIPTTTNMTTQRRPSLAASSANTTTTSTSSNEMEETSNVSSSSSTTSF